MEEAALRDLLPVLAQAATASGSTFRNIPAAIVVLQGNASTPFSPAAVDPLSDYQAAGSTRAWNVPGSDLLKLQLPCSLFLAPQELAGQLRAKAQDNVEEVGCLFELM